MKKQIVTWREYNDNCAALANNLYAGNNKFTNIIAVPRGGLIPAQIIAYMLDIPQVYTLGISYYEKEPGERRKTPCIYQKIEAKFKNTDKILIVDDIMDSGDTVDYIRKHLRYECGDPLVEVAVMVAKVGGPIPNYWAMLVPAEVWTVFPYEKE